MTKKTHEMLIEEIALLGRITPPKSANKRAISTPDKRYTIDNTIQRFEDDHRLAIFKTFIGKT